MSDELSEFIDDLEELRRELRESKVRLTVDLRFEGDYFHPSELVDVASDWIHGGLEDRDNLVGAEITGELLTEAPNENRPKIGRPLAVGDIIHGFAGGIFGRDHFYCTRVEAVGADWAVCRNPRGGLEFISGRSDVYAAQVARDEQCELDSWNCVEGVKWTSG